MLLKKILLFVRKQYQADPRALSLMRIGIALVVIADLFIRGQDLGAHYTDEGIWPTRLIYNFGWNTGYWSLHALSGSYAWELSLFILHFLAAASLLVGFKTRWSTLLTWLLTISLHNRNIFILQSGDDLLRLTLFWGLFLNWGQCYSMDNRKGTRTTQNIWAVPGYFALTASVYLFSALLKSDPQWHNEGTAVYYALSLDQLRLPLGDVLYNYPGLMKLLTHAVYYMELFIPVFIVLPSASGRSRMIAFILIVLLHLGIGLTLYVGLFFIIGMVSAIGLIPGLVLDRLKVKPFKKRNVFVNKPALKWLPAAAQFISMLFICICFIVNLSTVGWFPYELRNEFTAGVNSLRMNQYWGMFSPGVLKEDGWFVYHGVDSIGRQWDLRRNDEYVDYKKPEHVVSMYRSDRWRKLAENMQNDTYTFLRPLYCNYILDDWNKHHPEKKIFTLNLYFMQKTNLENYKSSPVEKKLHCLCDEF